jgi:ribosomal protein S12 methylthiotransferase accessory factor YcaO
LASALTEDACSFEAGVCLDSCDAEGVGGLQAGRTRAVAATNGMMESFERVIGKD